MLHQVKWNQEDTQGWHSSYQFLISKYDLTNQWLIRSLITQLLIDYQLLYNLMFYLIINSKELSHSVKVFCITYD